MSLRQQLRNAFLLLLKHTLNPLTRRLARSSLGPFSIIRHVGRRSGKLYETPIIVAPHRGGFVIELTYGPEVGARPVHSTLLREGILIVEHLINLAALPDEGFSFSAVPPKIQGVGTFPVRAFARLR